MTVSSPGVSSDVCYRCGYDLRMVADDQPCTECGLLAARSRRPTDELHHTRPGWLRRLSIGVWLVLLAIVAGFGWAFIGETVQRNMPYSPYGPQARLNRRLTSSILYHGEYVGIDLAAILLLAGVFLVTTREGYEPADRKDRWRRWFLRGLAFLPLLVVAGQHAFADQQLTTMLYGRGVYQSTMNHVIEVGFVAFSVALIPVPILLFFQLRSLAKRARSAHLAEHCAIVGVGNSATLVYAPVVFVLITFAQEFGLGQHWVDRSPVSLGVMALLGVAALLFAMWNVYLLVRFAIAFSRASRKLRSQWQRDDLSATPAVLG